MATALVPVFTGTLADRTVQLCDARTLHTFMQVRRDFSNWVKGRIRKFGFALGEDYVTISRFPDLVSAKLDSPDLANQTGRGGDRKSIDYHLTLDMAKELAMVENNEQGRAARRYFIECERKALEAAQAQPQQMRLDYDRISPAQKQDLKEIVDAIVKAGVQGYGETWARFQKKFKVNSYLELPATQHLEARQYLIAKLPKGHAEEVVDEAPKAGNEETIQQLVARWVEIVERPNGYPVNFTNIFQPLVDAVQRKTGKSAPTLAPEPTLRGRRWLIATDSAGNETVHPLGKDDFISNWPHLARGIATGDARLTNAELIDLASACNQSLVKRLGSPANALAV